MTVYVELTFTVIWALIQSVRSSYDPFSDSVQFTVNFPGPLDKHARYTSGEIHHLNDEGYRHDHGGAESVIILTQDNEKYQCIIPDAMQMPTREENINSYSGPPEDTLLNPLFEQSSCSYKIEPYWTYELCHRRYLRQYHEEKDVGKEIKVQEYYLGNYKHKHDKVDTGSEETATDPPADDVTVEEEADREQKVVLVGGQLVPYYEVWLRDGTPCDLTGGSRQTAVKYVCHELGRGEIYDLKELSTCQYEVIILTQLLCSHPRYRPHKDPINEINCHPLEGSPQQPTSLVNFELESSQGRYNRKEEFMNKGATKKSKVDIKIPSASPTSSSSQKVKSRSAGARSDKQLLKDFLSGEYCIQGGTGWWKHEFCYGKSVTQFHEERNSKTVITLGLWDEDKHVDWIEAHPSKRPSQLSKGNKVVHQYYGGGELCDLIGKPRSVEVKLRCKENPSHPNSIALFLVEPKSCEYNLVVESQILCPILAQADDDGLIDDPLV